MVQPHGRTDCRQPGLERSIDRRFREGAAMAQMEGDALQKDMAITPPPWESGADATETQSGDPMLELTTCDLGLRHGSPMSSSGQPGRLTDRVSAASVKAGAAGANAAGVTAKLVGCIR